MFIGALSKSPVPLNTYKGANFSTVESIGYIGRVLSHRDKEKMVPYIMQALLLLIAPALIAASIYMVLGRLMRYLDATHHSLVRVNWLTKVFVMGDVLSFMLQSGGGGMMAKTGASRDTVKLGEHLILGGLFMQLLFFSGFLLVAVIFHIRILREPTAVSSGSQIDGKHGWGTLLKVLYGTSALIIIRNVFRVVEYIQGRSGYLMRNEVWLYVFDAAAISVVVIAYNVVHPSDVILSEGRKSPADSQELEMGMNRGSEQGLRR